MAICFYKCECGELFTEDEAANRWTNVTDNYWEACLACPKCGDEFFREITKEEYEEAENVSE